MPCRIHTSMTPSDRLVARMTRTYPGTAALPFAVVGFGLIATLATGSSGAYLIGTLVDAFRDSVAFDLVAIVALAVFGVAHEAIHALAMRLFGNQPVFGVMHFGLALYASAPGQAFTRGQYVMTLLAPLVVISGLGSALMPLLPAPQLSWLICCVAVN